MNMMLIEVFACLVAASLLGLIVGWMIKGTLASKRLELANDEWNSKLNKAQIRAQQDTDQLETKVNQLGADLSTSREENESLSEALRENELIVHKARTDSIELSRQQADTQEKLQQLLKTKDEEIEKLKDGSRASELLRKAAVSGSVSAAAIAKVTEMRAAEKSANIGDENTTDRISALTSKKDSLAKEQKDLMDALHENQDTVAIDRDDLPSELLDETVRLEVPDNKPASTDGDYHDATIVIGDDTEPDAFSSTSTLDPDSTS